jgi:hypothetical protein
MPMRPAMVLLSLAPLLAGCASPPLAPDPAQPVLAALAGAWDNAAQYAQAPATLKVPPSVDGDWLDLQHAVFHAVDAPLLGDRVLYLEWRRGDAGGAISRQRIWSFRTDAGGTLRMDFFAFVDGAPWAGRGAEPGAFATLAPAALRGYDAACALRFTLRADGGFEGRIGADECTLTAASGRRMGIDAEVVLDAGGTLSYRESGRLADGVYAFRVPPSQPYRFRRLPR